MYYLIIKIICLKGGKEMSQQLVILINQVILFGTLIIIGYGAQKKGFLKDSDIDGMSSLCVSVMIPAMIISVIVNGGSREALFGSFPLLIAAALLILMLICLGMISGKILKLSQPTKNIHTCVIGFGNSGFMGFPILLAMYPDNAAMFVAMYIIADASLLWTIAPALADPNFNGKINFKKMISPSTICALTGVLMVFFNIKPDIVPWQAVTAIGDSSKYVAMLYIGADLGRKGIKKIFERPIVLSVIPIKLIIAPLLAFIIFYTTGFYQLDYVMMLTVIAMMPSMVAIVMIARNSGSDDEYASAAVLSSTIASIFIMPCVMWVIENVFLK